MSEINKISKMEQDLRGDFMRWWTHLYMGENASRNRVSILEGMRKGKMLVDTYVITLPESGNHILDIRPVSLLRKEERESREMEKTFWFWGSQGAMRRQRR